MQVKSLPTRKNDGEAEERGDDLSEEESAAQG
jgi:hypothetical protein